MSPSLYEFSFIPLLSIPLTLSPQTEVKDLKEQLTMFESASSLGALAVTSADSHVAAAGGHDDSMADLGIRKTLDFSTPKSAAGRSEQETIILYISRI